jgi:hypothetical protein
MNQVFWDATLCQLVHTQPMFQTCLHLQQQTLFLVCYTLMMGPACFSKTSVFIYHARFEVPTAVLMQVHVFWDVML